MRSDPVPTTSQPSGSAPDIAEAIAAKDLNNLYLTSCYFADPARYSAFCALYALMRVIDDRVDELPQNPADFDASAEHDVLLAWEEALFAELDGQAPAAGLATRCGMPQARQLINGAASAMRRFPFPHSLWRNFFLAMHRDIEQARFETYAEFLDYTEGASVAPTSIYLYLIASGDATGTGVHNLPEGFDLIHCGRQLGVFSYLAHILRDMALDLETGEKGLLYLAREDLDRFGLDEAALRQDLRLGRARDSLRELAADLTRRARTARESGVAYLDALDGHLEPDCAFILEIILDIYEQALDKLAAASFDPMAGKHHLNLEEKYAIVVRAAERLKFELPPEAMIGRPIASADSAAGSPPSASASRPRA